MTESQLSSVKTRAADSTRRIGAPPPSAVPLIENRVRQVPFAPLGIYAEDHKRPAAKAQLVVTPRPESEAPPEVRLRDAFDDIVAGRAAKVSKNDLRALQALALDTIHRTFDNKYGDDEDLLSRVETKRGAFEAHRLEALPARAVLAGRSLRDKQCDALAFVLRTFWDAAESDSTLRRAVLTKLATVGRQRDIAAILPHVRKGNSSDLYHGLAAIRGITSRTGSPQKRQGLNRHPVVGPLMKKGALSEDEHNLLVEMVLKHGTIDRIARLDAGAHFNPVFVVTFRETEPRPDGSRRPIQGIFKPETTWEGKDRAYFAREVSAYEFDRAFARSALVPPTVEGLFSIDGGRACELGSLQYLLPNAKPLGYRIREDGVEKWRYHDEHRHLENEPGFLRQMSRARTLLYVLGDPDKLASNVKPLPNLANFMVSDGKRLWLIDNAYSQGAAPKPDREILPHEHDGSVLGAFQRSLENGGGKTITEALATFISEHDASEVSRRTDVAKSLLEQRRRFP